MHERIFPGESELAGRMRSFDWSRSDLGPPEYWPENLRVALSICLPSPFPMQVWWGPSLTMLYNDASIPFLGSGEGAEQGKHPRALGRSAREIWSEIYRQIGPLLERVVADGVAGSSEDIQMFVSPQEPQEVYVRFSFSPIFELGGGAGSKVEGVFCACTQTTEKVLGTRLAAAQAKDLADREHRLAGVLGSVTDALWSFDSQWRVVFCNEQAAARAGLSVAEAIGKHFWNELFPAAIGNQAHAQLHRAMADRVGVQYELLYEPWNRWFCDKAYPTADGGLTLYSQEITDRKRADEKLAAQAEELRLITDSIPALISYIDSEGRYQFNNRAYEEWFGHPREEIRGHHMREVLGEAAFERLRPHLATALAGRVAQFEAEVPYKDGGTRYIRAEYVPDKRPDGTVPGCYILVNDITRRKEAEELLRESQTQTERQRRLYEAILANTPDLAYVFDLGHRFIYANEVLLKLWGRTWDDAIGKTCLELGYEPWHAAMHDREIQQVIASKQPIRGEVPFQGTFGPRIYDYIFVPVLGADGEVEAVAGTTRDVTHRKQAEINFALQAAVNKDLARLTNVDELLHSVGAKIGEHFQLSRCGFAQIDEVADQVVVTHDWHREDVPSSVGAYPLTEYFGIALRRAARAGETTVIRDTATDPRTDTRQQAARFVGSLVYVPILRHRAWCFLLAFEHSTPRDWRPDEIELMRELTFRIWTRLEYLRTEETLRSINEQLLISTLRQADEALKSEALARENEELFRTIADSIPQLAWMADAQGHVGWFNRGWLDYTGTTLQQNQGSGWKAVHHPDHVERVAEKFERHLREGWDWEDTFPLRGKDGQYRWFLSRMKAIRDESGKLVRFFGTNTDVTEQLAAEEALKESDRRKTEFLAILAHELRNPLAPIRNAVQLLKSGQWPLASDQQQQPADSLATDHAPLASPLEMMERQIAQMVRLVDDLLDVSRISRGKIELRRERVELASVMDQAIETCRAAIEFARHELQVTLPPQPVVLHADPVRLGQIVSNLLNNACKYSEPEGKIVLTAERQGSEIAVSIKDAGVGIPAEMLPNIFEMFTQVDRSLERTQGGLGIGLTLVKSLVEQHGGTVEARSDGVGYGSEFIVRLPLISGEVRAASDEHVASPLPIRHLPLAAPSPRRILVVDDNQDAATSLAMLLKLMGNETRVAHDGLAGVEAAETFNPDVVLLDIGMPKLNGYEAARKIRSQPWGQQMVLVALTGWGQEADRRNSSEAGFNGHMVKPVEHAALLNLLAEMSPALPAAHEP